ncbi:antirestriction protein ArdA [bacterium]|nr:antirestriction protein ArdA [bacterium]
MTTTEKKILAVYITNLGKYNEGYLIGEWVELPVTDEELKKVFERIGINEQYEEYFITDYESDFGLTAGEYSSINELNEQAERLAELDEYELDIVAALLSEGYELADSLDRYEDVMVYYDCNDMTDVAYAYIEETGMLNGVPESIARYFDYEAFGRDMSYEGQFIFTDDGNCIQVF